MNSNSQNAIRIAKLKSLGYQVEVEHQRPVVGSDVAKVIRHLPVRTRDSFLLKNLHSVHLIRSSRLQEMIYPYGGKTIVTATKNSVTVIGIASCSSKDLFCRNTGSTLALLRVSESIGLKDES